MWKGYGKRWHPGVGSGDTLQDWDLTPACPDWSQGWETAWQPGESGASARLEAFLKNDVSDSELRDHCRIFLANYKTPRHWVRVDDLPLNASGKIDKPLLRRLYGIAG